LACQLSPALLALLISDVGAASMYGIRHFRTLPMEKVASMHGYLTTGSRALQLPKKVVLSMVRFRHNLRIETGRHQGSSERCALALIADNSDSFRPELRRRRNSGQNKASFSARHNVESAQDEHSLTSPSFPLFQWQCLPRKRNSPHGLRGRLAA
jgi:hypothetical protein